MLTNAYYRLDHDGLQLPMPTIWIPLATIGGATGAASAGFEQLRPGPLPISPVMAADLHTDRKISLVAASDITDSSGKEPAKLLEVAFPDDHPPGWLATAHQHGQLLVLASETDFASFASVPEALSACWAVRVPLVVRLYPGKSVGTSRPAPPPEAQSG